MFPIHDNIPSKTTPIINYIMIAICCIAFAVQLMAGNRGEQIVELYGMIPARVIADDEGDEFLVRPELGIVQTPFGYESVRLNRQIMPAAFGDLATLVTCIFLHGGWLHFLGNMWFLYIFGDNVEDRMGHVLYLLFYLAGGVLAGLSQILVDPSSLIPTIGASGAIAAVMGAYVMLYPKAIVETILPLPILFMVFPVPAPLFLGVWFFIQLFNGASGSIGGMSSGVAWWAHIGGFVVGFLAALGLNTLHWLNPPVPKEDRTNIHVV